MSDNEAVVAVAGIVAVLLFAAWWVGCDYGVFGSADLAARVAALESWRDDPGCDVGGQLDRQELRVDALEHANRALWGRLVAAESAVAALSARPVTLVTEVPADFTGDNT